MIIEVEGDLILSGAEAVAHVVAPNDDFHTGLALAMRQQSPALYKDFRHFCRLEHPKAGSVWAWKGAGGPVVYNLMAQEAAYGAGAHPGKASLPSLNHCLAALRETCDKEKHKTLAMSRLATGVGGLQWDDVKALVEKHFADAKTRVYVYSTFRPGQKAVED